MAFLTQLSRKMYLTDYINKTEMKLSDLTRQKLDMTDDITRLTSQISDIGNNESPAVKKLEARLAELKMFDAKLDIEKQKMETKLQAAQTEMNSLSQSLNNSIQSSFTVHYAGAG